MQRRSCFQPLPIPQPFILWLFKLFIVFSFAKEFTILVASHPCQCLLIHELFLGVESACFKLAFPVRPALGNGVLSAEANSPTNFLSQPLLYF